jgi:hypothetical protein
MCLCILILKTYYKVLNKLCYSAYQYYINFVSKSISIKKIWNEVITVALIHGLKKMEDEILRKISLITVFYDFPTISHENIIRARWCELLYIIGVCSFTLECKILTLTTTILLNSRDAKNVMNMWHIEVLPTLIELCFAWFPSVLPGKC